MKGRVVSALWIAVSGACSPSPTPVEGPEASVGSLALQPGDAVRLEVWREGDLSGEFPVDDRGIVVLPLLGERRVTGLAPDALRDSLVKDFRTYLQNPSVRVTLLRRVVVLGEVRNPGLYAVDVTMTLTDLLALAGGVAPTGDAKDIRLIRDGGVVRQDLDRTTIVGSTPIRSGDQIVVGQRSWLSRYSAAVIGSVIAAGAIISAALIN